MSSKNTYNIGTTVYYEGDDANKGGFGEIVSQYTDYLGELEFDIRLEDGRVLRNMTPSDFDAKTVLGNKGTPELYMVEAWEQEMGWDDEEVAITEEYMPLWA